MESMECRGSEARRRSLSGVESVLLVDAVRREGMQLAELVDQSRLLPALGLAQRVADEDVALVVIGRVEDREALVTGNLA